MNVRRRATSSGRNRIRLVVAIVLAVVVPMLGAGPASAAEADIASAGPLTSIRTSTDLNCAVNHTGDLSGAFFDDTACGTFLVVDGTLYSPASVPAGSSAVGTPWTPVSQTAVTGAGTAGSPYQVQTVVAAGSTGRDGDPDRLLRRRPGVLPDRRQGRQQRRCPQRAPLPCRRLLPRGLRHRAGLARHRERCCRLRERCLRPDPPVAASLRRLAPLRGGLRRGVDQDRGQGGVPGHLPVCRRHRQRRRTVLGHQPRGRRVGHPVEPDHVLADRCRCRSRRRRRSARRAHRPAAP